VKVEYVRVYLPRNETATRKNRDVSASYYIGARNCYDSLSTNIPVLWNDAYSDELVYPNPFSRETQIRFSLANDAPFSLSIYNGQGQMVRSLWNGQTMRKGSYLMVWDGRNDAGSDLAPGIYYLQFRETGGAVRTQKITLQP
jgi:hypothetical protein